MHFIAIALQFAWCTLQIADINTICECFVSVDTWYGKDTESFEVRFMQIKYAN